MEKKIIEAANALVDTAFILEDIAKFLAANAKVSS